MKEGGKEEGSERREIEIDGVEKGCGWVGGRQNGR